MHLLLDFTYLHLACEADASIMSRSFREEVCFRQVAGRLLHRITKKKVRERVFPL